MSRRGLFARRGPPARRAANQCEKGRHTAAAVYAPISVTRHEELCLLMPRYSCRAERRAAAERYTDII